MYMSGQTGGSGAQPLGQPMTGPATDPQSPGSGRTYGEANSSRGFDFGWMGLLGLAGLLGLRRQHRGNTFTQ
jgi:MYXO-CTERM domain-containing protein